MSLSGEKKGRDGIFRKECFVKHFTYKKTGNVYTPCKMSLYVFGVDLHIFTLYTCKFFYFFLYKQKNEDGSFLC